MGRLSEFDTRFRTHGWWNERRQRVSSGPGACSREKLRFAFRCYFGVEPWSDYTELHWGPDWQIYVSPVAPTEVCVVVMSLDRKMRIADALRRDSGSSGTSGCNTDSSYRTWRYHEYPNAPAYFPGPHCCCWRCRGVCRRHYRRRSVFVVPACDGNCSCVENINPRLYAEQHRALHGGQCSWLLL